MPIIGLTDRKSVTPRLTRLGKVRKGTRDQQGNPLDLEYLRFVPEGPHQAELEAIWLQAYGPQPVRVNLYLPLPTLEENWKTWMEKWSEKQGLQHRCNGQYLVRWLNKPSMRYTSDPDLELKQPCPYNTSYPNCAEGCKQVGRLTMILPPFLEQGFAGYVVLEVHSKHDLPNISAALLDIEIKAAAAHRSTGLQGIEFILTRRLDTIGTRYKRRNGDIVKSQADKWMLHLAPSREWMQAQLADMGQMALGYSPRRRIIDVPAQQIALPILEQPEDDFIPSEPEPETETSPAPPKPESPAPEATRPTSAAEIKARLLAASAVFVAREQNHLDYLQSDADPNPIEPSDARRGIFAGSLGKCFAGNTAARRAQRVLVTWWIFNTTDGSSKTMTVADISAWSTEYIAPPTEEKKYPLQPYAVADMAICHTAALKAAGQMELEGTVTETETPEKEENGDQDKL